MIRAGIDRTRPTGGGMALSFIIHGGLLVLMTILVGRQTAQLTRGDELTEIAYIETRYGQEVAAQVKIKEKPGLQAPAQGVATRSAVKPVEPLGTVDPEPVTPSPAANRPASRPKPRPILETRSLPTREPRLAVAQVPVDVPAVEPQSAPRNLAPTRQLASRAPAPTRRVVPGGETVNRSRPELVAREKTAPAVLPSRGLESAEGSRYQAPAAALVEVSSPGNPGGQTEEGRRTILDYGSGSGGSLTGRRRLAEPTEPAKIVAPVQDPTPAAQVVAEATVEVKGVNMSISGQIQGRKILRQVAPVYSEAARRNGWEGTVAVHFTVKADGLVKENMYFQQTSVHRDLNQAAMAAIKDFIFAPLQDGQTAMEQWGVITIVFRLN
jgi:TonB family protein